MYCLHWRARDGGRGGESAVRVMNKDAQMCAEDDVRVEHGGNVGIDYDTGWILGRVFLRTHTIAGREWNSDYQTHWQARAENLGGTPCFICDARARTEKGRNKETRKSCMTLTLQKPAGNDNICQAPMYAYSPPNTTTRGTRKNSLLYQRQVEQQSIERIPAETCSPLKRASGHRRVPHTTSSFLPQHERAKAQRTQRGATVHMQVCDRQWVCLQKVGWRKRGTGHCPRVEHARASGTSQED